MQKVKYYIRQCMVGLLALQLLNVSVGNSSFYADTGSHYSTTTGRDPIETAVELLVEAGYGQCNFFTCKTAPAKGKSTVKSYFYQFDLFCEEHSDYSTFACTPDTQFTTIDEDIFSIPRSVISPPPRVA